MGDLRAVELDDLPESSNFLQSNFWAAFKSAFGWRPYTFTVHGYPLVVLVRTLPGGVHLAYVPHPFQEVKADQHYLLGKAAEQLRRFLPPRTLCIRFDIAWELPVRLAEWGIPSARKAEMDIQPPSTVVLSLDAEEDALLQAMKRKTRYNIRLAGRKGVTTRIEPDEFLDEWYSMYRETAERDQIAIHSYEYYRTLLQMANRPDKKNASGRAAAAGQVATTIAGGERLKLHLISARHEGDLLAGIIVAVYGRKATYMYGASSNYKRNLMASYAVQWEAIRMAKQSGCTEYDLFGIPPADDPEHPMHGLYRFKTGFGGRILHRPGTYDVPLSVPAYQLFRGLEKARNYYYKKLKKR